MLQQGDRLPEFETVNQDGEEINSDEIEDAIVYFYPKADTPGCTREACSFRDSIKDLEGAGIEVYGVSVDTVEDQKAFQDKYELSFDLIADADGDVADKFGVLHGTVAERTSFIVRNGRIDKIFRDVDPDSHVSEVLDYLGA